MLGKQGLVEPQVTEARPQNRGELSYQSQSSVQFPKRVPSSPPPKPELPRQRLSLRANPNPGSPVIPRPPRGSRIRSLLEAAAPPYPAPSWPSLGNSRQPAPEAQLAPGPAPLSPRRPGSPARGRPERRWLALAAGAHLSALLPGGAALGLAPPAP